VKQDLRSALDPGRAQPVPEAPLLNQLGETSALRSRQYDGIQTVHGVEGEQGACQGSAHRGERRCCTFLSVLECQSAPEPPGNPCMALAGFTVGNLLTVTQSILPMAPPKRLEQSGQEVGIIGHAVILAQAFMA
jgi:hypothetical protein